MVEGESGILAVSPPRFRPVYEPTKRRLTWPNGAMALCLAAEEPDQLRGKQQDGAWADELASWPHQQAAWDQLMFGLRLGVDPRVVATTTPKPTPLIRSLLSDPTCVVTKGSTYENLPNLPPQFLQEIVKRYEGTRLGLQELHAHLLEDVPGALWTRETLEATRVNTVPELRRVAVAVDPSGGNREESSEAGIVAGGLGLDGQGYVLEDGTLRGRPDEWARQAVALYNKRQADRIVAEVNFGGDMVELTIRTIDRNVPVKKVTASRGKQARAEPVAALYEQGRVHHVGFFAELEDEQCSWVPGEKSPNRMDALVWLMTDLFELDKDVKVYGTHYKVY